MSIHNRSHYLIAVTLSLFVSAPAVAKVWFSTKEFDDGETRPVSIAILPPDASVSTQRLIRRESEVEESTEYGLIFARELADALSQQGYEIEVIDSARVNADPRLQEAVIDAKRRNEDMLVGVNNKELKRREYQGSEEARILADYLDVDAIGFAELDVVAATGGKKAMSWILGGSTGGSSGSLNIVDGNTGYLEASLGSIFGGGSANRFEEDPAGEITDLVDKMMNKLPDADPSARVETATDDEDVFAEIESLLNE
jgi:hypothetical protein